MLGQPVDLVRHSASNFAGSAYVARASLCRHVHRELLRSVWLDLTPIIYATACYQRNDVERYSRSRYTAHLSGPSCITIFTAIDENN